MAITVAAFQTALDAVVTAIEAGDWGTARTKYTVAEAINAGLAVESHAGSTGVTRRETLAGLRAAIDAGEQAAARYSSNRRFIATKTGFGGGTTGG